MAVQQLGQLKRIANRVRSDGKSTVTVEVKDKYDKASLPQVWDELRRKVNDVQKDLPPGAGPSLVVDDFGDVWGVFVVLYGDEYSYRGAQASSRNTCAARVHPGEGRGEGADTSAIIREVIYIEPNRDRMSQLGIHPPTSVADRAQVTKNIVTDAGRVEFGAELHRRSSPPAVSKPWRSFESILISDRRFDPRQIYLRDVATVRRGYDGASPEVMVRYDGKSAIGIGISTVSGGNVVVMGEALSQKRAGAAREFFPLGVDYRDRLAAVRRPWTSRSDGFVVSLYQAVLIVVVVLLFFMGLRSGLLIGFILVLTICGDLHLHVSPGASRWSGSRSAR